MDAAGLLSGPVEGLERFRFHATRPEKLAVTSLIAARLQLLIGKSGEKNSIARTQGDEGDQGTDTFHRTASLVPIFVGGLQWAPTPELFGPRNPGHEAGAL